MPEPKHMIPVCSYCEEEFPAVKEAIRATMKKYGMGGEISFSHGYCVRHYIDVMKQYGSSEEQIKTSLAKVKNQCPDLKQRPDLVNLWSKGIFTQEQLQNVQQGEQKVNEEFIGRLRTLAGIRG
jgi:hypothetical protein